MNINRNRSSLSLGYESFPPRFSAWTRRKFLEGSGLLAALGFTAEQLAASQTRENSKSEQSEFSKGFSVYKAIGVEPIINCQGTYTILSGSLTLPEVKKAMEEASLHYVHLDELMEKVGQRLAELTGAEFGIVTAGCAAALTHVTAACVAGADPEKMQRLPDVTGLKSEVIMPKASRNMYDHAIRMVGVRIIEVENSREFRAAITQRTAMITIMGDREDRNGVTLEELVEVGKERDIPILVDAAAERPDVPNYYLKKGVDVVAYSGGKCLRGPQCSGLALGRRDLLWAAWLNSAPHHAFGRPMKVGKEEIMGLLAALEAWIKYRDHQAEWKRWESWLRTISGELAGVPTVKTTVVQPGRSNVTPTLSVKWDSNQIGITAETVKKMLDEGTPRIWVPLSSEAGIVGETGGISIVPYMMQPGEDKLVARRLREVLANSVRNA